jgi:hypothetical protein
MIAPFGSSDNLSGVLWHSSGDAQRLFFAVGGCTSMPITTIARAGGITTVNLSYIFSLLSVGSRVVVYGVADNSFNGGDGQNPYATVNSVSGLSISFPTLNGSTAASTGGRITWCDGMTGPRPSGVMLADVSNGTASTTQQDWTWGTLDVNNTDTANPALGNTCAEFLSGGQNPLNGVFNGAPNANGGASPGLTIDTVTNKIVGWPNEGTSIYQITPDPVNKRWTCSRQTYTANDAAAAPVDTSNNGAPHSTWGTWHRFSYFPQADVFFLINAPDQPARILRIR